MSGFISYGRQTIEADDLEAVARALQSALLTTGPLVQEFEAVLARVCGARHAIACNSGTAALHLALAGAGFGPGDVAIVPSITFVATANVARLLGGEVVFSDVDPNTGRMRLKDFETALHLAKTKGRARAVLPVHMGGQAVEDLAGIRALAERQGLSVVEDACHAIGARHPDATGALHPVGACASSDAACFSFHPVKAITTGEGGAVVTNSEAIATTARMLRSHGLTRDRASFVDRARAEDDSGAINPWYYEQVELGLNYRLPDVNCALGLSQLAKLDRFMSRRRHLVQLYRQRLHGRENIRVADDAQVDASAWHLLVVHIDFKKAGTTRASVMKRMSEAGIGTQVHYIPVHSQPYYVERYGKAELPGAEAYYAGCLSLPLYPALDDTDVDRVVSTLCRSMN